MRASIALQRGKTSRSLEIEVSMPFKLVKDDEGFTAYAPFIDFCRCAKDEKDAQEMFKKGVRAFLKELVQMGTLDEFLHEQGWRKSPLPQEPERWVPPELIWMQEKVKTGVAASK